MKRLPMPMPMLMLMLGWIVALLGALSCAAPRSEAPATMSSKEAAPAAGPAAPAPPPAAPAATPTGGEGLAVALSAPVASAPAPSSDQDASLADAPAAEMEAPAEPAFAAKVSHKAKKSAAAGKMAEQAKPAKPAKQPPKPAPKTAAKPPPPKTEPTVKYLSADDSNSAASPVIARKLIRKGRYVQPNMVRTYEFLNYYTFDYPAPEQLPISVVPQMRALEKKGEYSLQVAVRSQDRSIDDLLALNVTFVLDVSGSMAGEPFALARAFLAGFVAKMRAGDLVSIVTCNRKSQVLLDRHRVDKTTPGRVRELLAKIQVNDITDLEKGVLEAYRLADKSYDYKALNRVILISDGADNAGKNAVKTIAKFAQDTDKQGIYLAGVGLGTGFNDYLMDTFTDKGRGAYLFVDSKQEVDHILEDHRFVASFDIAVKDVRLKMVMPPGWKMKEFHGEQVSSRAADVVPQYLSPNDQMIYHLTISTDSDPATAKKQKFEFEAEYRPLGGKASKTGVKASVAEMLATNREILKGDAVVAYAEVLKKIKYPLLEHKKDNLRELAKARESIEKINEKLKDKELAAILALLETYKGTLRRGEQLPGTIDREDESPAAVLGLSRNTVRNVSTVGNNTNKTIKGLKRLGQSTHLLPVEGYRFLVLSSGRVFNPHPAGGSGLYNKPTKNPTPQYMGSKKVSPDRRPAYDLHQIKLELTAPKSAKSFSFDFNFFSSEYPQYVNQNFNDTFYAILQAKSTNRGKSTNIAFDAKNNSIEVDNNYFQQPFHPIPNMGTGFDHHGSTGWLRTSWPIEAGEKFVLTFSIHDEGDAIYDSLVVLDNFQWNDYDAVGTTDPLN